MPSEDLRKCRDCGEMVPLIMAGNTLRFAEHGDCPGWFADILDEEGWANKLESRFTRPRPDCLHPERWHSLDADSTEVEVTMLVAAYVRALRPDVVVETGSAWGQTAKEIGEVLAEGGYGGVLHTIEPDRERAEYVDKLCAELPVNVYETTSLEWMGRGKVEGFEVGFAWFDSLHHLRVPEFRALYPHFAPGAFVGFHDCAPHQGSLWDEILQLESEGLLLPIRLPTPRGVCFAEVLVP